MEKVVKSSIKVGKNLWKLIKNFLLHVSSIKMRVMGLLGLKDLHLKIDEIF